MQLLRAVRKGEGRSYAWLNGAGHDPLQGVVSNNMPATYSKIVQTPPQFVSSAMKSCAAADWSAFVWFSANGATSSKFSSCQTTLHGTADTTRGSEVLRRRIPRSLTALELDSKRRLAKEN